MREKEAIVLTTGYSRLVCEMVRISILKGETNLWQHFPTVPPRTCFCLFGIVHAKIQLHALTRALLYLSYHILDLQRGAEGQMKRIAFLRETNI